MKKKRLLLCLITAFFFSFFSFEKTFAGEDLSQYAYPATSGFTLPYSFGGNTYTDFLRGGGPANTYIAFFNDEAFSRYSTGVDREIGIGSIGVYESGYPVLGGGEQGDTQDVTKEIVFLCTNVGMTNCSQVNSPNGYYTDFNSTFGPPNFGTEFFTTRDVIDFNGNIVWDNPDFAVDSGNTRIISVDPFNGDTVSSTTPTSLSTTIFIYEPDFNEDMFVSWKLSKFSAQLEDAFCVGVADCISDGETFESSGVISLEDFNTSAGLFIANTVTPEILAEGKYKMVTELKAPFLWFWDQTEVATTTEFFVGGETAEDIFWQGNNDAIHDSFSGLTGSIVSSSCAILTFNLLDCLVGILLPDPTYMNQSFQEFKTAVGTHFPLGYITDLIRIISATSTQAIPVINAVVPIGLPGTGATINLDITNAFDYILDATSTSRFSSGTATSTQTFYQITSHYWNILIYIAAGLYIMRRIFGSHIIPKIHKKE